MERDSSRRKRGRRDEGTQSKSSMSGAPDEHGPGGDNRVQRAERRNGIKEQVEGSGGSSKESRGSHAFAESESSININGEVT